MSERDPGEDRGRGEQRDREEEQPLDRSFLLHPQSVQLLRVVLRFRARFGELLFAMALAAVPRTDDRGPRGNASGDARQHGSDDRAV
jgi:hypothetical protein